MEKEISRKPYVVSPEFNESRIRIYEYSLDIFGYFQAERYKQKIRKSIEVLDIIHAASSISKIRGVRKIRL